MKSITKIFALIFALMLPASVLADEYSPHESIDRTTIGSTANLYVYPDDNNATNPAGCSSANRYVIKKSHPAYDYLFTMIQLAWKNEYTVAFYVSSSKCDVSSPSVIRINVSK